MLEGSVANKAQYAGVGSIPVNTILFQAPIRKGFSGAPIFDTKGHVVGIVDTLVFGIGSGLAELRNKWLQSQQSSGRVVILGVDIASGFLEMINNLDANLISGLGTGVSIGYAKAQQAKIKHASAPK